MAVEIETGKSDVIGNIHKCLDYGYKEIIIIATNWKAFISIKESTRVSGLSNKIKIVFVNKLS